MFIHEYGSKDDPLVLFPTCGYMAAHSKEYAEEIETFLRRRQDVLG